MKQLLIYLTRQQLQVFDMSSRHHPCLLRARPDPDGAAVCTALLERAGEIYLDLLLDVADEEFQIFMLPRLRGSDQRQLLQRKLAQLFADTPFRCAARILRPAEAGPAPALLSGLRDEGWIEHWLHLFTAHGASLQRIVTPPLLLQGMMQHLPVRSPNLLLFHLLDSGLVRQTCLVGGQLRFSRILDLQDLDATGKATRLLHEAGLARQYLASLRLLQHDETIEIIMVGASALRAGLSAIQAPEAHLLLRWLDHRELAALGTRGRLEQDSSSACLAALARHYRGHHYLPPSRARAAVRHRVAHQVRRAAGGSMLVLAALMPPLAWQLLEEHQQRAQWQQRASALTVHAQAGVRQTGVGQAAQADALDRELRSLQAVVRLQEDVLRRWPQPEDSLRWLASVLDRHPRVELSTLEWSCDRSVSGPTRTPPARQSEAASACHPTLALNGHMQRSDLQPRAWLADLQALHTDLEADGRHRLEWLIQPLDLRHSAVLRVEASSVSEKASTRPLGLKLHLHAGNERGQAGKERRL